MIILLFFSFLSLTAIPQNAEKKITIQNKNISLKEAFEQIELQTGYSIAYEQSDLDLSKKPVSYTHLVVRTASCQCAGLSFPVRADYLSGFGGFLADCSYLSFQETYNTYYFMVHACINNGLHYICSNIDPRQCQYSSE